MLVNTHSKYYNNKGKGGNHGATFSPSSYSSIRNHWVDRIAQSQGASTSLLSSNYNIMKQLANIKVDATLFDIVIVPLATTVS